MIKKDEKDIVYDAYVANALKEGLKDVEKGNIRDGKEVMEELEKQMQSLVEQAEEETDVALADAALKEHKEKPKTYSHEEVKKKLGL